MASLMEEQEYEKDSLVYLSLETLDPLLLTSCKDSFELATMHCLALCEESSLFMHGPRQGIKSFRDELADFLRDQYKDEVSSDNLMVTGGLTQALMLLCNVFFEKGDKIYVEELISPTEREIFNGLGLSTVPVPMDEDGLDVNKLETLLSSTEKMSSSKPFRAGVFLTPHFHNPTGTCLTAERCQQLAQIVAKHNVLCISNDIYNCFSYGIGKALFGPPPKRLFTYATSNDCDSSNKNQDVKPGHIVSLGSFSTIFSPGIRMGWLEACPYVLEIIINSPFVKHCGAPQQYLAGLMESVLSLGLLKDSFASLQHTFNIRLECLCRALGEHMPNCKFTKPKGGLFVWIELPSDVDAQALLKLCREKYQVDFLPGNSFCSDSSKFKNSLRLSITRYGDQTLIKAVTRIGEALKQLMTVENGNK